MGAGRAQSATRSPRWRRWAFVVLAVLGLHGVMVLWLARSHPMIRPAEPEQIVPTLLLHPEPVQPPAPPAKAQPKPAPAKPRPAPPQPAQAPTPTPTPAATETPALAPTGPAVPTAAGPVASADSGGAIDLGAEREAPPADTTDFSPPPSATLHYATFVNGIRNEDGVIRWATDGKTYTLSVEIPLPLFFGAAVFRSMGSIGTFGLAPTRYEEVRGRRQPDVTTFHYAAIPAAIPAVTAAATPASDVQSAPTVTFTRTPAVLPLPEGTQDRFSVFLQLTGLARANPSRFTSPGITLDIPIADTDSVEVARVQRIGEDTFDTPQGPVRAQHFVRLPRRADDRRRLDIWLSAERGWLPVYMIQTEPSGMQFELLLTSQEGGGPP